MENSKEPDELSLFQKKITVVIPTAVSLALIVIAVHIYNFALTGKADQEAFAQFGDYLGGILNPILGFTTILLLIYSIQIQAKELKNAREEMKIANREAKRSSEAALKQAEYLHTRAIIDDTMRVISELENNLEQIFNINWEVPENYVSSKIHIPHIYVSTVNEILRDFSLSIENVNKKVTSLDIAKSKTSVSMLYLSGSEHIAGDENSNFIKKYIVVEARKEIKSIFRCICELIELNVSSSLCQQLVDKFTSKLISLERIGMNSNMVRHLIMEELEEAKAERLKTDPNFKLSTEFPS